MVAALEITNFVIMDKLPSDLIFIICSYYEKNIHIIRLLSTTTCLNGLKNKYTFDKETVSYKHIKTISYKENIKNVCIEAISELMDCKHITHLTFANNFNQKIVKNILPCSLTHLTFGHNFNKYLEENVLPLSLTHLTFGFRFKKSIEQNVLPPSLTHLTLGYCFNQAIKQNVLPPSLTHLTFGHFFESSIGKNVLPHSLTHLTLSYHFIKPIKQDVLPSSVTHLCLNSRYPSTYREEIPSTISITYVDFISIHIE
jgi:hypothetical protein